MAGSDEDDRGSDLLSVEEEEDSDLEAGMDGAGGRAVDADASEEWTTAAKGREKAKRRQSHIQLAAQLDATCEEDAYEEGLLMPRTLAELTSQDSVLWVGQELSCRAELSLRVAEDCEAQQRFYTANNGQKKSAWSTLAGRPKMGPLYANYVCREDKTCAYSVKVCMQRSSRPGFTSLTQMWHGQGSWFNEQSAKGEDKMGWKVEEYVAHTCDAGVHQIEGPAPSKKGARKSKGQKVGKGAPRKVAQKKVAHKKGYAYCSCSPITRKPVSARTEVLQQL